MTVAETKRKKIKKGINEPYTLETPIVKEWIKYRASEDYPRELRTELYGDKWEAIRSQESFLSAHGKSEKARATLYKYEQIDGFEEAMNAERRKFERTYGSVARRGLYNRAKGMRITTQKASAGQVVTVTETLPPDVKACEIILKAIGDFVEKTEHNLVISAQQKWLEAAEEADKDKEE